jgi:5-methyltetrahydropteroyltriglutamate--homocysteine methyltransferase
MRAKPPFRADHVGSLLRPQALKEARAQREKGAITAAELKAIEDREIKRIIDKQQEIGLKLATDGEFRRAWWHFDFLGMLDGVELYEAEQGIQFQGTQTKAQSIRITGKLGFSEHPMLQHFGFLKANCRVMPKMTIPSPSVLHFRLARDAISKTAYSDLDHFFQDLGDTYRKAVQSFYQAGCRYLQFDDTVWAYLCSQEELRKARERIADVDALQGIYAGVIKTALSGKPADMTITTHVCRGNFRSTWIAEGGYEPVAETLLGTLPYDGYFLEYDTDRAGGFEPLHFLPEGEKIVVLGLVTSKTGTLERKDDIKRRIDQATKYVRPEQLCVSPQCGFASTEEGNILAEEEQWAKLRMIVELADEVWGRS